MKILLTITLLIIGSAVKVSAAYPKKNVMIGVTGNYVPSFGVSERPSAMLGISHETLKFQIDLFGRVIRYEESTRRDLSFGSLYFFSILASTRGPL